MISTDGMILALRKLQKLHENDFTGFGETRWTDVCRDVADRLEEQEKLIDELRGVKCIEYII